MRLSLSRPLLRLGIFACLFHPAAAAPPRLLWAIGGHQSKAWSVAGSPDGQRAASGNPEEGTVKLWRLTDGRLERTLSGGGTGIEFSRDGTLLITHGRGPTLIYRAADGELLASLLSGEGGAAAALSNDNQFAASGGSDAGGDEQLRIWTIAGQLLKNLSTGLNDPPSALRFSHDHQVMIAGYSSGVIRYWDIAAENVVQTLPGSARINTMDLSPDGQTIVVSGPTGFINFWDYPSATLLNTVSLGGPSARTVDFSSDGTRVLVACSDGSIQIRSAPAGALIDTWAVHPSVNGAAWVGGDASILTGGDGPGLVRQWDTATGSPIRTLTHYTKALDLAAAAADADLVAAAMWGDPLEVRRASDGALVQTFPDLAEFEPVRTLALSPDGAILAEGDTAGDVRLWNVLTGELITSLPKNAGATEGLAFSADGTLLVEASRTGATEVRRVADGAVLMTVEPGHRARFSPDGALLYLAVGFTNDVVGVWRVPGGQLLRLIHVGSFVRELDVSPDGKLLVSGSTDRLVRLFDAQSGDLLQTLGAFEGEVNAVAFARDSRTVAAGSRLDPRVRLWSVPRGTLVAEYDRDTGAGVSALACSADNQSFIAARRDATLMSFRNPRAGVPGDLNCDGMVNFGDITPFVLALSDPAGWQAQFPDCFLLNGDINEDGRVDFGDINPFVDLLATQ